MIDARCHCGAVRLTLDFDPESVTQCTCSICRRYGAQWAYGTSANVGVSCDPGAVTAYAWGDRSIEFWHCNTCGCLTHYESTDKTGHYRVAVNARMLAPEDAAGIRLRTFDGADSWKYLD